LILIVQFPRGLRNFICSPQKPVVVVFPFPYPCHGDCNSTFLYSFNLYSRIIWFTNFVRADHVLASWLGRQNHSHFICSPTFEVFYITTVSPPENSFTYPDPLVETPAFVSLSSPFPPVCSKTKEKTLVGRRLKSFPVFFIFSAYSFPQLTSPPNCKFWYCIKKPSGIPTSRILSR